MLQKRVLKAEARLRKKEQENTALVEKVKQYKARWLEYEAKIKSMEEMWQKQTTSLQVSLIALLWITFMKVQMNKWHAKHVNTFMQKNCECDGQQIVVSVVQSFYFYLLSLNGILWHLCFN